MTQAFNLSQLANNLDSSGRLDATDGLVNAVPVANGGTGASTSSAARTNLGLVIGTDIPSPTGTGASGTWNISINGNAATATSATTATTASNGGVTSVNGLTGAVTISNPAPTTAQVLNATAGASVGVVGTYAMLSRVAFSGIVMTPGSTYAGSDLRYAGGFAKGNTITGVSAISSTSVAGTWRCMGYANNTSGDDFNEYATLFLRIS